MYSQSPLRGSGRMQINSQHMAAPAGMNAQRFNDIMTNGPAQNEGARSILTSGHMMTSGGAPLLRNYNS